MIENVVTKRVFFTNFFQSTNDSTHGLTIYNKSILLPDVRQNEDGSFINKYFILTTLLHEIAHIKRILFTSGGDYFTHTPKKYGPKDNISCDDNYKIAEAGKALEYYLFGKMMSVVRHVLVMFPNFPNAKMQHDIVDAYSNVENWQLSKDEF